MKIITVDWIKALWAAKEAGYEAASMGCGDDDNPFPNYDPRHYAWMNGYWGHYDHHVYTDFGVNGTAKFNERVAYNTVVELAGVHLRQHGQRSWLTM